MLLRPSLIHTCYAAYGSAYDVVAMQHSDVFWATAKVAADLWGRQSFNQHVVFGVRLLEFSLKWLLKLGSNALGRIPHFIAFNVEPTS